MGIDPLHGVSEGNRSTINKFCSEIQLDGISDKTISNYKSMLAIMGRHLKATPYSEATKEQMQQFFLTTKMKPASVETMKIAIKRFYRWLFDLPSDTPLPESVRWIKFRTKRTKRRETDPNKDNESTITDEEYQLLQQHADQTEYPAQTKALLEVLRYFGVRVSELLSMNVEGVQQTENGLQITILKSKTNPRTITADRTLTFLPNWIDAHPFREQKGSPLWVNFTIDKRVHMQRLGESQVRNLLHDIQRNAGITRTNVHPHAFRHTCITDKVVRNHMPPVLASKFFAVSIEVINDVYAHQVNEELLKYQNQQRVQRGDLQPTYNEITQTKQRLEQDYNKRLQEMEQKFKDMELMLGFTQTQKRLHDKQTAELQAQDNEMVARGEL